MRLRVIDGRDALSHEYDVLLIDDVCSFLDRRLVDDVRRQGKGIVVVLEDDRAADAREWVERLGVLDTVSDSATPEDLIERASMSARSPRADPPRSDSPSLSEAPRGRLLAVMGCSGGVGATEIAIAVSCAWPGETILVDLDTVSPSVAQRLGLRLLPNLRSALQTRRKTLGSLEGELHFLSTGVRVLPGLASSGDWRELPGRDTVELLEDLRRFGDVVVNLPAGVPARASEQRPSDVVSRVLEVADTVVVVTLATPVGVSRLFEWAAAARVLGVDRPAVLFNSAPRSAFARGEIEREVGRVIDPVSIDFLPADDRVLRAGWQGTPVGRGPFVRAVGRAARQWARA